jgi:hypothetical protein
MGHIEADIFLIVDRDCPRKLGVPNFLAFTTLGAGAPPKLEGVRDEEIRGAAQPKRILILP